MKTVSWRIWKYYAALGRTYCHLLHDDKAWHFYIDGKEVRFK